MYKIIRQDNTGLEVALVGHITADEFEGILTEIHSTIERETSACVLIDFRTLDGYDKIFIDKNRFFDSLHSKIERAGIISGGVTAPVFLEYLRNISQQFQIFEAEQLEEARNWVFNIQ